MRAFLDAFELGELHEITRDGDARDVRVEVTVNGQNYTDGGVLYRYYDDTAWRIHGFHPRGGPLGGNTSLAVTGMRLQPLGDVRCRYGVLTPDEVQLARANFVEFFRHH